MGFGVWLLYLVGQSQHPKPSRELLNTSAQGFIFGIYQRFLRKPQYLTKPEQKDGHILIAGPPGTQKSKSLAIPSLWVWQDRIFAIAIKGELFAATVDKPGQRRTS